VQNRSVGVVAACIGIIGIARGAVAPATSVLIVFDSVARVLLIVIVIIVILSVLIKFVGVEIVCSCRLERDLAIVSAPAPARARAALRLALSNNTRAGNRAGCDD